MSLSLVYEEPFLRHIKHISLLWSMRWHQLDFDYVMIQLCVLGIEHDKSTFIEICSNVTLHVFFAHTFWIKERCYDYTYYLRLFYLYDDSDLLKFSNFMGGCIYFGRHICVYITNTNSKLYSAYRTWCRTCSMCWRYDEPKAL